MKRVFVLSLLLFLAVPCAQGQEPPLLHGVDFTVSGAGGVKHNAPGVLDTDVFAYTGLSAAFTWYIANRENRRHPGVENRHRLGVAFSSRSRKMSRGSKMPVSSAKRQKTMRTRNCSRSCPL